MTAVFDTAVSVVQACGNSLSDIIAAIRRLCVIETRTYDFCGGAALQRRDEVDASARNRTPETDELTRLLFYAMSENFSMVIFYNSL